MVIGEAVSCCGAISYSRKRNWFPSENRSHHGAGGLSRNCNVTSQDIKQKGKNLRSQFSPKY